MNPDDYIQDRLQNQIDWYDRKSMENQKRFRRLRKAEIVAATFIPFVSGIAVSIRGFEFTGPVITGLLGVIVSIVASIIALGQHQENWIKYRTTCESLKKEKYLFQASVEPYDGKDAFPLLVQRVENLISKENTNWSQIMMKHEDQKKEGNDQVD